MVFLDIKKLPIGSFLCLFSLSNFSATDNIFIRIFLWRSALLTFACRLAVDKT